MSKKVMYRLAFWGSLVGILWVFLNAINPWEAQTPTICIFKNLCHYPCPACGSTHAVIRLMHLDIAGAIYENPLGLLWGAAIIVVPIWVIYDKIKNKESLYTVYCRVEQQLKRKPVLLLIAILILANWAWSLAKFHG